MCMASLIFSWKLVQAESRILKQASEQTCLKMRDCLLKDSGDTFRRDVHGCRVAKFPLVSQI